MTTYSHLRVPVVRGELAGGIWTPAVDSGAPPVLAIHGITASHLSWPLVAERLGTRLIAMDLRGRGASNTLPGPFNLRAHARDLLAVLDHVGVDNVVVAGHSMGAFVAVRLAELVPERLASLVLIDGGLPIAPPEGVAPQELAAMVLGPALSRLSMTFASRQEYTDFWRSHAALGPYWNQAMEAYVNYDLHGEAPHLSASSNPDAVAENALELDGEDGYHAALQALSLPMEFLHAPRGLADQVPPLYPDAEVSCHAGEFPHITFTEVNDVNHYTIVLGPGGAEQVASTIAEHVNHARPRKVI